jgi:hypothetical protein
MPSTCLRLRVDQQLECTWVSSTDQAPADAPGKLQRSHIRVCGVAETNPVIVRQHGELGRRGPFGIPDHFPNVTIGVLEIPCVPAPEGAAGGLEHPRPGFHGCSHHRIHRCGTGHVVPQAAFGRTCRSDRKARVMGEISARPEREPQPALELEERYRAMRKLLTHNPRRWPAEPIAIERDSPREIINSEGEDGEIRVHGEARRSMSCAI